MDEDLKEYFNSLEMQRGINLAESYHRDVYNILFQIKTELAKGERVLEIGTGRGLWAQVFDGAVGLDIAVRQLRHAKEKGIQTVAADCRCLPFPDGAFGCVFSLGVIEHFDGTEQAIDEHVRVCRPGGIVLIGAINKLSPMALSRFVEMKAKGMTPRQAMTRWGKRYTPRRFMEMMDHPRLRNRRLYITGNILSSFVLGRYAGWFNRLTKPILRHKIGNEIIVVARKRLGTPLAEAQARYEQAAAGYDNRYRDTAGIYFRTIEERYLLDLVGNPEGRVLDLGTGAGRLLEPLATCARLAVGIDVAPAMLEHARRRDPRARIRLALMDGTQTAFRDGVFDAVVSAGGLESMYDLGPIFGEVGRLLRPGGRFVFTYFNRRRWRPLGAYALGDDTRAQTLSAIDGALAAAGLRRVRYHGTFFLSPKFVWKYHYYLCWPVLRRAWIGGVVTVNRLLNALAAVRSRCGQFVILAEKVATTP